MFYEWNDSMSVGVPLINNDHRALIHLINRLHESVSAQDAYDILDSLLNRLLDYVDIHFTREERMMEACGYTEAAGHKEQHAAFIARMHGLRNTVNAETAPSQIGDLAEYLKNWLNQHILIQDKAYRRSVENNPGAVGRIAEAFGPGLYDKMPEPPARSG